MREIIFCAALAITVTLALAPSCSAAEVSTTRASASQLTLSYKGFNYVSYYNGGFENANSLPALAATGANSAALTLEYGIDVQNSTVYADTNYTDSLNALAATIEQATSLGLAVMVRPMIDFLDPAKIGSYSVGDWRSYYNPTDAAAFFASYKSMILSVAATAQANGATILCIGVELDQLTGPDYLSYWTDIISSVRAVFSGKLIYSADWDANLSPWQGHNGLPTGTGNLATQVSFWSELDYLGIDCYAPISDAANPVLADLTAGWTQVPSDPTSFAVTGNQSLISYFESVATQTGKPLIFTEIGYESASDAAQQPAGSSTNLYDPALQTILYAAFFEAWQQSGDNRLAGVYFWNWDPNAAEVGPGNGANFSPQALPAQLVATAAFTMRPVNSVWTSTHDFNGDGYSDIEWRDGSGDLAVWLMMGAAVMSSGGLGTVPTTWSIVGQRDFNGDGKYDLLWRNTIGDTALWFLSGATISSSAGLGNIPTIWTVIGTGDFDGDGLGDVLWRDNTGNLSVWLMNGATVTSWGGLGNVPLSWAVVRTGDFNGDGKTDVLWRDGSGNTAMWFMNGTRVSSSAGVGNIPIVWSVVGTGDFNGDGMSDIIWRDNSGNTAIWLMNGATLLSSGGLGNVPTSWSIVQTGDYNGDGMSDFLWRDTAGNTAMWFMNGTTISSAEEVGNISTAWTVLSVNAE